jgi:hypothetical protein
MDPVKHVRRWAKDAGIKLNGIQPKAIPGRGIGVVATRDVKVSSQLKSPHTPLLVSTLRASKCPV